MSASIYVHGNFDPVSIECVADEISGLHGVDTWATIWIRSGGDVVALTLTAIQRQVLRDALANADAVNEQHLAEVAK